MQYDIFISYSRQDNNQNQIATLVTHIAKEFEAFAGRPLRPFFDTKEISGGEYWQDKILTGLRESRLMLACLSPGYLASQWCEWEFNEYQKYELGRAFLGRGMAPIYFVQVPGFELPDFEASCARWISELRRRQHYDLRPWHMEGEIALQKADVAARLEELTHQVWEQIRLGEISEKRKGNLDRANERFVGRVQEMQRLHKLVGLGRVGVLTAVNGLGGIGKTALALQYAHAYWDTFAGGCWQIRCEGKTDLKEAFASLRGQRDMDFELTEEEKKSIDLQFERVLRELKNRADAAREIATAAQPSRGREGNTGRVLVLLDNVDKPELLSDEQTCRLPQAEWLCLLATTRLGAKQLAGLQSDNFLSVDELPEKDALALIEMHQPGGVFASDQERQAARDIIKLLGGMPLAVESAAVYLGEYADISCAEYLAGLRDEGLNFLDETGQETSRQLRHGEKRLAATLKPTLDKLSTQERLALDLASLLPADHVPLPWLRELVAKEYPEYGKEAKAGRRDSWVELVRHLLSLRLLQETGVTTEKGFPLIVRMHRLVGAALKDAKQVEATIRAQKALQDVVESRAEFLKENWVTKENRWEISPLFWLADLWLDAGEEGGADLANSLTSVLSNMACYVEVSTLLPKAVAFYQKAWESGQPALALALSFYKLALSYSNLARVSLELGFTSDARFLLQQAVAIYEKFHEGDDLVLASAYSDLALTEKALGNLSEAQTLLQQAVNIHKRTYAHNHPTLAVYYANLCAVESDLGNLNEARSLMLQAVAINEQVLEPGHPALALSYANLGMAERNLGNLSEARSMMQKAVAIDEKVHEPDHPAQARNCFNLATVEMALGNLKEARTLMQQAVAIEEGVYDHDHPTLALSRSNLALVEQNLGNLNEAANFQGKYTRFLQTQVSQHNRRDLIFKLALAENQHGNLLQQTGRLEEAEVCQSKYVALIRQLIEEGRTELVRHLTAALDWHGNVLEEMGRLKEAEACRHENVEICRRLAAQSGETGDTEKLESALAQHAILLQELGNLPQALVCRKESLLILQEANDEKHFAASSQNLCDRLWGVADLQENLGLYSEAKHNMTKLFAMLKDAETPEQKELAAEWLPGTYAKLADILVAMKDYSEAMKVVEEYAKLSVEPPKHDGQASLHALKLLQLRGRVAHGLGDFERGIACFREGRDMADRATASGQEDTGAWADALQYQLAQTVLAAGGKEAEGAIDEAVCRSRRSLQHDGGNYGAASFLARSLILQTRLLLGRAEASTARRTAEEARELLIPLAEREWARRQDLAECCELLAEAHDAEGGAEQSAYFREQAISLRQRPESWNA